MASLSESVQEGVVDHSTQAAPRIDKSQVGYGQTKFGRGANQIGDNPSAQLADSISSLANTAVTVVDTAHKYQQWSDSELDKLRQEALQQAALEAQARGDTTEQMNKTAAAINMRYRDQMNLKSSQFGVDNEIFKLDVARPGARLDDIRTKYANKRRLILNNMEMSEADKAKALQEANTSMMYEGELKFGHDAKAMEGILADIERGTTESKRSRTAAANTQLKRMAPAIQDFINVAVTEISEGRLANMDRAEFANYVLENVNIPEEMQNPFMLDEFNTVFKDAIDSQYNKAQAAIEEKVNMTVTENHALQVQSVENTAGPVSPEQLGNVTETFYQRYDQLDTQSKKNTALGRHLQFIAETVASRGTAAGAIPSANREMARAEMRETLDALGITDEEEVNALIKKAESGLEFGYDTHAIMTKDNNVQGLGDIYRRTTEDSALRTAAGFQWKEAVVLKALEKVTTELPEFQEMSDMQQDKVQGALVAISMQALNEGTTLGHALDNSQYDDDTTKILTTVIHNGKNPGLLQMALSFDPESFDASAVDAIEAKMEGLGITYEKGKLEIDGKIGEAALNSKALNGENSDALIDEKFRTPFDDPAEALTAVLGISGSTIGLDLSVRSDQEKVLGWVERAMDISLSREERDIARDGLFTDDVIKAMEGKNPEEAGKILLAGTESMQDAKNIFSAAARNRDAKKIETTINARPVWRNEFYAEGTPERAIQDFSAFDDSPGLVESLLGELGPGKTAADVMKLIQRKNLDIVQTNDPSDETKTQWKIVRSDKTFQESQFKNVGHFPESPAGKATTSYRINSKFQEDLNLVEVEYGESPSGLAMRAIHDSLAAGGKSIREVAKIDQGNAMLDLLRPPGEDRYTVDPTRFSVVAALAEQGRLETFLSYENASRALDLIINSRSLDENGYPVYVTPVDKNNEEFNYLYVNSFTDNYATGTDAAFANKHEDRTPDANKNKSHNEQLIDAIYGN